MKSLVTQTDHNNGFIRVVLVSALCLSSAAVGLQAAGRNPNPGVAPITSSAHGHTYGEWAGAWWQWAAGVPADQNPILDATGEFGHIDQEGHVFFLAGSFGSTEVRELTIPAGKSLFFPIFNSLWWAPDDVEFSASYVADQLGLDPAEFTDEELVRLAAIGQASPAELELTCTIDGVPLSDLGNYWTVAPGFQLTDTDLLDDLEIPVTQPNTAVAAGYWIMLHPLTKGTHTIRFTVAGNDPFWGEFALDVTYHLTVE